MIVAPGCSGGVFPFDAAPLLITDTTGAGACVGVEVEDGLDVVGSSPRERNRWRWPCS